VQANQFQCQIANCVLVQIFSFIWLRCKIEIGAVDLATPEFRGFEIRIAIDRGFDFSGKWAATNAAVYGDRGLRSERDAVLIAFLRDILPCAGRRWPSSPRCALTPNRRPIRIQVAPQKSTVNAI